MAHRIYTLDRQQGIEQAWHGKTEILPEINIDDNYLTSWDLQPVPLQKKGKDSKWCILESTDVDHEIGAPYNPLTFTPLNNRGFLDLVKASIAGTKHQIISVGSLRNRGRIFISIRLVGMEQFKASGREFSAYLNFGNGHDKSSVLWVNTSNTCTVCDNTFTCNLVSVENKPSTEKEDDNIKLSQRHTKNIVLKLPALATLIDKAVGVQGEFQVAFEQLGQTPIGLQDTENLFAGFLGTRANATIKTGLSTRAKNTVDTLVGLHVKGRGNNGETLADAFSAVTDFYTHLSSGKDVDPMKQVISSDYGAGAIAKAGFWSLVNNANKRAETLEFGKELLAVKVKGDTDPVLVTN